MSRRLLALCSVLTLLSSQLFPSLASAQTYGNFIFTAHPDYPGNYLQGQLGVLLPTIARSFLVVAYRYVKDKKLTAAEQKNAKTLIDNRWLERKFVCDADSTAWAEIRATVPGVDKNKPIIKVMPGAHSWEDNDICNYQTDGFRTAAKTLKARIDQFGIDSPKIKEWVKAQDIVFANGEERKAPDPLPADADKILRKDREYQIAAALFYSRDFTESAAKFDEIARDQESQWHTIAPYLACRALVRQATWKSETLDLDLLAQAEKRLQSLLQDKSAAVDQVATQALLNFVMDRTQPAKRLAELSEALNKEITTESLDTYTRDFDRLDGGDDGGAPNNEAAVLAGDNMSDWINTFKAQTPEATKHCFARWQESKSELWLTALLTKLDQLDQTQAAAAVAAGGKIQPSSASYPTASYFTAKYLIKQSKFAEARQLIDQTLANQQQALGASSHSLFLTLRLPLSQSISEFLKFGIAQPSGGDGPFDFPFTLQTNGNFDGPAYTEVKNDHTPNMLPEAKYFADTEMPLSVLTKICHSEPLPAPVNLTFTRAIWVRATLLNNDSTALELASMLLKIDKVNAANFRKYLDAKTPEERRFAVAFVIEHDDLFDPLVSNMQEAGEHWWWGSFMGSGGSPEDLNYPFGEVKLPFLSKEDLALAIDENKKLESMRNATAYMCSTILDWSKTHPLDPDLPEALHFMVRATHFAPTGDESNAKYSRSAFQLLHSKYPTSPWTKKTPYWYN